MRTYNLSKKLIGILIFSLMLLTGASQIVFAQDTEAPIEDSQILSSESADALLLHASESGNASSNDELPLEEEPEEIKDGLMEEDGNVYFYQDGQRVSGQIKIDGNWYYFDETTYAMVTGWKNITASNKLVYYDSEGRMVKGQYKIGSSWYYFNEKTGARVSGWKYWDDGKKWVYYKTNGVMAKGQYRIAGNWYYFKESTGERVSGWKYWNDGKKWVYYKTNGVMAKGQYKVGNNWYYFNEKTGARVSGWKYWDDGKKWVYYKTNGAMAKGQYKIGGSWYYFDDKTGQRVTGWKKIANQNKTVYYDASGKMVYGDRKIGNSWYYFNTKTGKMYTGWLTSGGKKYYYNSKGQMLTGVQRVNGEYFYFNSDGSLRNVAYALAAAKLDTIGWSLQNAFNWAAYFPYATTANQGNCYNYAVYGFNHGYGDCYVKAATFYQMAVTLGYKANMVNGVIPSSRGGYNDHAWTEIYIDGVTYVADPDFTQETGKNGLLFRYGTSGTWRYTNYKVYS